MSKCTFLGTSMNKVDGYFSLAFIHIVAIYSRAVAVPFSTSVCVLRTKHKTPNAGGISCLCCCHEQVDGIFLSCFYTRREDVCSRVIAAPFTWTSVSACALSDRRYIALLCSYTFSVLLLHRCVLFVSRCRCTIHSVRLPHVSACPFLWAT